MAGFTLNVAAWSRRFVVFGTWRLGSADAAISLASSSAQATAPSYITGCLLLIPRDRRARAMRVIRLLVTKSLADLAYLSVPKLSSPATHLARFLYVYQKGWALNYQPVLTFSCKPTMPHGR